MFPDVDFERRGLHLLRFAYHHVLTYLFLGLLSTLPSGGQSMNLGITHHVWGMEDGLPDQVILAVAQTPDGYLWLGTPHGLVRFDGFKFTTIEAHNAPTLQEFGVSCILVDRDGSLWVGSVGGGVTHLKTQSDSHFGADEGLQSLSARALYQTPDGVVWAGTDGGLYQLVGTRFRFVEEFGHQIVTGFESDGTDGFWVAGVSLAHYRRGRFLTLPLPPLRSVIRALAKAPNGGLWIAALGKLMERKADGSLQVFEPFDEDIRTLTFDQSGVLWIGTVGNGLFMRKQGGSIVQVLDPKEPDRRVMRSIVNTRNGDLWIGTDAGLYRLSHTGMDFLRISNHRPSDFGSVFFDRDNSVWLSAGNLTRFAGGTERTIMLPQLKGLQIRAAYRDSSGAFWVGTLGNGAYRLERGRVVAHYLDSTAVTGFLEAPDGSIWIGTDTGLARWKHGQFASFPRSGKALMNTVKAMALAPDGSVWIATPAGLFLFHDGDYSRPEVAQRLVHNRIWSLYADRSGSLWVGAGTGLYVWRDGALMRMALPTFLFRSQAVISILVDAKSRFLIATPTAVFRINRNDLEHSISSSATKSSSAIREVHLATAPEIFDVSRETGTELYSEIPGVASADLDGGAWYATYQGLLHISTSSLAQLQAPPPVTIEKVLVDGAPISQTGPIHLSSSTHNVQIQATPILPSGGPGLQLRRRLFGFDEKWSELVPGSSSSYGKLAPGQYTFRVEAYWPGMDTVSSAEVILIQESAIYQRKSFIVTCCMLVALFAWLVYRFRIRQMTLRFQAVADERGRVAREIHDTLLQGCIGALSLLEALEISHDRARSQTHPQRQEDRWVTVIQCVREQFGETIKEAREAIWNLRNSDDRKSLDEALRDALGRLTSRAGIQTSFQIEGARFPLIPRVQHEIVMAAREAILNAVSHAHPGSIVVQLNFDPSNVIVSISDDGVGFNPKSISLMESDHFGIAGMRDRMSKFRGSMTIESEPGKGTTVRLSLPLSACCVQLKP